MNLEKKARTRKGTALFVLLIYSLCTSFGCTLGNLGIEDIELPGIYCEPKLFLLS